MPKPALINPHEGLYAIERLKEAIHDLEVFLDPNNPECDVRKDARGEGTQLYVETWVMGPMKEALRLLEGRDPE